MNQSCKVCGEPAAGFHFGAFTCEGCKSFFGRSYNNLSSITECKSNGECIINKKNRTTCKACRLRKCLLVGMSKSGSRYGRRSNWFKIHCLLQEQQQQAAAAAAAVTSGRSESTSSSCNKQPTSTLNLLTNSHQQFASHARLNQVGFSKDELLALGFDDYKKPSSISSPAPSISPPSPTKSNNLLDNFCGVDIEKYPRSYSQKSHLGGKHFLPTSSPVFKNNPLLTLGFPALSPFTLFGSPGIVSPSNLMFPAAYHPAFFSRYSIPNQIKDGNNYSIESLSSENLNSASPYVQSNNFYNNNNNYNKMLHFHKEKDLSNLLSNLQPEDMLFRQDVEISNSPINESYKSIENGEDDDNEDANNYEEKPIDLSRKSANCFEIQVRDGSLDKTNSIVNKIKTENEQTINEIKTEENQCIKDDHIISFNTPNQKNSKDSKDKRHRISDNNANILDNNNSHYHEDASSKSNTIVKFNELNTLIVKRHCAAPLDLRLIS